MDETDDNFHDGNLVFTNTDPQCESGIVCRLELEKGFDYEFAVELAEAVPGEKVEGFFLQAFLAGRRPETCGWLEQSAVGSGAVGSVCD